MNTNINEKTPVNELKRQVKADINKVKQDIDSIQHRLTPGQIIDEAIYYRRGGGDPAMTFQHLKNNPVGTAFLTLGTILLMEDQQRGSYEKFVGGKITSTGERIAQTVRGTKAKLSHMKDDIKAKLPHGEENFHADGIDNFEVKGKIADLKDTVRGAKDSLMDAKESARGTLQGARANISEKSHMLMDKARDVEPMVYMALGLGLGAFTGSALPISSPEEQVINGRLKESFAELASEMDDALNQALNTGKNEIMGGVTDMKFSFFS